MKTAPFALLAAVATSCAAPAFAADAPYSSLYHAYRDFQRAVLP